MTIETPSTPAPEPTSAHIIAILDKSGSMRGKEKDVIGGFNAFIEDQKSVSVETFVSLYIFDDHISRPYYFRKLDFVPELNSSVYSLGGSTALLDTIGTALDDAGDQKNVILLIVTDGQENASKEYIGKHQIQDMLRVRENLGWKIVYMGAHADAFTEARKLGVSASNSMEFTKETKGFYTAFASAGELSKQYRSGNRTLNQSDIKPEDLLHVNATYGSNLDTSTIKSDKKTA